MKVILLKDVRGVGQKGQIVEVSDGYGLNSLIPNRVAEQATAQKIAEHTAKQEQETELQAKAHETLNLAVKSLENARITLKTRATEKGGLFKSITQRDITRLILEQRNITLAEEYIVLDVPLKQTGEHHLKIRTKGAEAQLTLSIESA